MTKDLFHKNQELRKWFAAIVDHENWDTVLLFARSAFLEHNPTQEQLQGAKDFERALAGLPASDDSSPGDILSTVKPGLVHQIETVKHLDKGA
jgi:hypothetical protein